MFPIYGVIQKNVLKKGVGSQMTQNVTVGEWGV